jgi:hypothetical protein
MQNIYQLFNEILVEEFNAQPLEFADMVDFNFTGNETTEEIRQLAAEWVSECHTERCQNSHFNKYGY